MNICGLDASSSCTGISVLDDKANLIFYNKLRPSKKGLSWEENICDIIKQIIPILKTYKVEKVYMEDVPQYVKKGSKGGNLLKTPIVLGGIHMLFYYILHIENNIEISFLGVDEWREKIGFLKDKDRTRDNMKDKAVKYINNRYSQNFYYVKGKKSVKDDDDICESICIALVGMGKVEKIRGFGKR